MWFVRSSTMEAFSLCHSLWFSIHDDRESHRRYFALERLLHLESPSELNGTARQDFAPHRSLCDDHQIGSCKQRPGVCFGNGGHFGSRPLWLNIRAGGDMLFDGFDVSCMSSID